MALKRQKFTFDSKLDIVGDMEGSFSQDDIRDEPMVFNCDVKTALRLGGPITNEFVWSLCRHGLGVPTVIDTRVHMLMPGWFPCIPGWHHDDVERTREDGQPNYRDPEAQKSWHVLSLVNGDIAPTEFAVGSVSLAEVLPGEGPVYKTWNTEVDLHVREGGMSVVKAPSMTLVKFDAHAFHRGVRTLKGGWRWFGRASWDTSRVPSNELRRQVQVYMENPMEGW